MSVYEMKVLQYEAITEMFEPVLFYHSPFYYETGTMAAHCDGARDFRGHYHAGGWTYRRNAHLFVDQNKELWEKRCKQAEELFYLICGPYNDTSQHFAFNYRPVFEMGLKGIYERAVDGLKTVQTEEQKEFLEAVCKGLLCFKKMSEKFAEKAEKLAETAPDEQSKNNLHRIYEAAKRTPWEKPESFYEALNSYAFLRKAIGSLEGIGVNSFGRVDMDLYPFYQKEIKNKTLTEEKAYELICQFLITGAVS